MLFYETPDASEERIAGRIKGPTAGILLAILVAMPIIGIVSARRPAEATAPTRRVGGSTARSGLTAFTKTVLRHDTGAKELR